MSIEGTRGGLSPRDRDLGGPILDPHRKQHTPHPRGIPDQTTAQPGLLVHNNPIQKSALGRSALVTLRIGLPAPPLMRPSATLGMQGNGPDPWVSGTEMHPPLLETRPPPFCLRTQAMPNQKQQAEQDRLPSKGRPQSVLDTEWAGLLGRQKRHRMC